MHRTKLAYKNYVLTNDPSITAWGWAVLNAEDNTIVDCGAIKTTPQSKKARVRKGDDRVRRVQEINHKLIELIKKYKPVLLISELPHGSQSAVAAVMIGMVTAIVQTLGDSMNVPVEWFSESDSKLAVIGSRSAQKDEMVREVCKLFYCKPWKQTKWENEAIADALAVYFVAMKTSAMLKMAAAR